MDKNPLMEKTEEVVSQGGLLARLYFDIHAKSKEGLKDLAVGFSSTLKQAEGVVFAISEIEEPMEEQGTFSTYITATLLFEDPKSLFSFIIKHTPLSVEVLKPEKLEVRASDLSEAALLVSSSLYDLKMKMYSTSLGQDEKSYIEQVIKHRQEIGRKLRGGSDG